MTFEHPAVPRGYAGVAGAEFRMFSGGLHVQHSAESRLLVLPVRRSDSRQAAEHVYIRFK